MGGDQTAEAVEEWSGCEDLVAVVVLFGLVGCLAACLVRYASDLLFCPEALRDGQYVFVFISAIPTGWVVGCLAAAGFLSLEGDGTRSRGSHIRLVVVGALLATPLTLGLLPFVPFAAGLLAFGFGGLGR